MASDESQKDQPVPPPFYAELADKLSQGDIVYGVPLAAIDTPLTICRPGGKPKQAWFAPASEATPAAFPHGRNETIHAVSRPPALGMVLWDDCQIDKDANQGKEQSKWIVAVVPVVPLATVTNTEHRKHIEEGRRHAFFPVPAFPDKQLPEAYIDLRYIIPVKQDLLGKRIVGLTPESLNVFRLFLFRFLTTRQVTETLFCPACHNQIETGSLLQTVAE